MVLYLPTQGECNKCPDCEKEFLHKASIEEYISLENMYNGIKQLKETDDFNNLNVDIQRIAIAYSMWYESDRENYKDISLSAVNELLPEWIKK